MKRMYYFSVTILSFGLLVSTVPQASGALLAYEGFDYSAGSTLVGQGGGFGFSTAWGTSAGTATIESPGMSYGSVEASGGKLYVNGGTGGVSIFRDLSGARGDDGTTSWISLMHIRTGVTSSTNGPGGGPSLIRPVNFSLFQAGTEILALGEGTRNTDLSRPDTDVWGFVVSGQVNNVNTRWTTAPLTVESFALVRIDHGAGNVDTAYMWINPSLAVEPDIASAAATTTGNFNFNRVRPFAGNAQAATGNVAAEGYIDEFRLGQTFNDVTLAPIPEPTTYALFGLGALFLCWKLRKQNRKD